MTEIAPTSAVGSASAATDPGAATDNSEIEQAFATGIVEFMGTMLQSMESDIQQAAEDTTSDPDAPS